MKNTKNIFKEAKEKNKSVILTAVEFQDILDQWCDENFDKCFKFKGNAYAFIGIHPSTMFMFNLYPSTTSIDCDNIMVVMQARSEYESDINISISATDLFTLDMVEPTEFTNILF